MSAATVHSPYNSFWFDGSPIAAGGVHVTWAQGGRGRPCDLAAAMTRRRRQPRELRGMIEPRFGTLAAFADVRPKLMQAPSLFDPTNTPSAESIVAALVISGVGYVLASRPSSLGPRILTVSPLLLIGTDSTIHEALIAARRHSRSPWVAGEQASGRVSPARTHSAHIPHRQYRRDEAPARHHATARGRCDRHRVGATLARPRDRR